MRVCIAGICLVLLMQSTGWAADAVPAKKATAPAAPAAAQSATDQLTLDATTVTGNRELPKVMYIVPWKKAELGQLPGQPFNSLLNEVLQPVDREVFRRQVNYYQVVAGKDRASPAQTQPTAAADSH